MNVSRRTIAIALFKQLQLLNGTKPGQYNFETFSRAAKMWTDVPPASQPAAFQLYTGEAIEQLQAYGGPRYVMNFRFLIYMQTNPGDSEFGENVSFDIMDSLCGTGGKFGLLGNAAYPQTLGNIVLNAWVEGEVLVDTGVTDQQMAMVIPIKVLGLQ